MIFHIYFCIYNIIVMFQLDKANTLSGNSWSAEYVEFSRNFLGTFAP